MPLLREHGGFHKQSNVLGFLFAEVKPGAGDIPRSNGPISYQHFERVVNDCFKSSEQIQKICLIIMAAAFKGCIESRIVDSSKCIINRLLEILISASMLIDDVEEYAQDKPRML